AVINNRRGTTFWQIASSRGIRTAVLEAPINFPPEKLQTGVLLSGLGVPDIRGTMGTFSYFATDATGAADTERGGKIARLARDSTSSRLFPSFGSTSRRSISIPAGPPFPSRARRLTARSSLESSASTKRSAGPRTHGP